MRDDDAGDMVIDYMWIDYAWSRVARDVDHRNLDDVMTAPTTSENLAKWVYGRLASDGDIASWRDKICAVRVSETDETWAEYQPAPYMTHPTA